MPSRQHGTPPMQVVGRLQVEPTMDKNSATRPGSGTLGTRPNRCREAAQESMCAKELEG